MRDVTLTNPVHHILASDITTACSRPEQQWWE